MGQELTKKRSPEDLKEFILSKGVTPQEYNTRKEIFHQFQDGKNKMNQKEFTMFMKSILKQLKLEQLWDPVQKIIPGIFSRRDCDKNMVK